MDIVEILTTIKEHWALLVFVFGLGAAWYQGIQWFKKINDTLGEVGKQHSEHSSSLDSLHRKVDAIDGRVDNLESSIVSIKEHIHETEVDLAVLQARDLEETRRIRKRRTTG